MSSTAAAPDPRTGLAYAVAAYGAWGFLPLYFHALTGVPAEEILAHRITWSCLLLGGLVTAARRWPDVRAARAQLPTYLATTALITTNWLLYIWAATHGRVLEASLGYYINPLVNVALGVLVLGERLRPRQLGAIGIAAVGVAVLVLRLGAFPWIALTLAGSFGLYGLLRKRGHFDPLVGLFVETALLAPFTTALLVTRAVAGTGALGHDGTHSVLLLFAGVVTATPLIWFAHGVRSLRLSTMGLVQYLAPTLQFLCAVVVFHEPFQAAHAVAFGLIWVSLAVYTADALAAR